jgi:hypothetical protein
MRPSSPSRSSTAGARALVLAATAAAALLAASQQPDAIANRLSRKLGVGVEFRLTDLIDTVLKPASGAGKGEINDLAVAIVAILFIGTFVYFIFGLLRTLAGRRGGIETVGQVVFALLIGIAGLEVLA